MNKVSEFDFKNTFPPLGHPEHHFNKYPNHPWLKTKDDIKEWLRLTDEEYLNNESYYQIYDDLTVTLTKKTDIQLYHNFITNIPIQFRIVSTFVVCLPQLTSLIGSPYYTRMILANRNKIKSFIGITKNIKCLQLDDNELNDFMFMPSFNSDLSLYINGNPIKSWDGFTNCNSLWWWQDEWCDKTSLHLLMHTPENISQLLCQKLFISNEIIKENERKISMSWLRNQQKKIKDIKELNNNISNTLKVNCNKNNIRKI